MKIDVTRIQPNEVKKETHNWSDAISISNLQKKIEGILADIKKTGALFGKVEVTTGETKFTLIANREPSGAYLIDTKTTEVKPVA